MRALARGWDGDRFDKPQVRIYLHPDMPYGTFIGNKVEQGDMQEDSSNRKVNDRISPREQAEILYRRVEELILDLDQARDRDIAENKQPPSWYAIALATDVASLLHGISEGWIDSGQERIANGLLLGVADLVASGHSGLAASFTSVLRVVSCQGLAAANCSIGRRRFGHQVNMSVPSLE